MKIVFRDGSIYHIEPATILDTPQAKAFLKKCAVEPHLSQFIVRDENGETVDGPFVLHRLDGPATETLEKSFGVIAFEYFQYGVRHRVGGPAVWETQLYEQHWRYGEKTSEKQSKLFKRETLRVAQEAEPPQ